LIWGSGKEEYFPRQGLTGRLRREGATCHDRITAPPNRIFRSAQDNPLRLLLLEFRDCLCAIGLRDGKLDLIANLQSIEKQPVARFEILPILVPRQVPELRSQLTELRSRKKEEI
jgi:hypothetical protein